MNCFCDWLSLTISTRTDEHGHPVWLDRTNPHLVHREALSLVYQNIGKATYSTVCPAGGPDRTVGRFPYKYGAIVADSAMRIFYDPGLPHILMEVPGQACDLLTKAGLVNEFIGTWANNLTRIDLSVDIETPTRPVEFLQAGHSRKFTSTSTHVSLKGETAYVGSPKSDRRAAVYRYNPPNPRHKFLRVEHRFKRDRAKQMGQYVKEFDVIDAVLAAGEQWGWLHPDWAVDDAEWAALDSVALAAKDGDTERWLLTQVVPAIKKLERSGTIPDLRRWMEHHLFDDDMSDMD